MKRLILINIFIINVVFLYAGDGEYAVSKISSALMKNANAVLRFEDIKFEIHSAKEAIETNHYVITILNENGDKGRSLQNIMTNFARSILLKDTCMTPAASN
jgi:hypothetical protein